MFRKKPEKYTIIPCLQYRKIRQKEFIEKMRKVGIEREHRKILEQLGIE